MLSGLKPAGACPECGTDIALSLREPTLASADPEYVRTITRGLGLVLVSILISVVSFVLMALAGVLGSDLGLSASVTQMIGYGLDLLAAGMGIAGYWLYTQPDPSQVAMEHQRAARKVIRAAVVVMLCTAVGQLVLEMGFGVGMSRGQPAGPATALAPGGARDALVMVSRALGIVSLIAWAVLFFAVMRYTRWVAGRVPDQWIVRRTKTYMWLLPVLNTLGILLIGLGPIIALVLYWNLLDRLRKHTKSIIASGAAAALPRMAG